MCNGLETHAEDDEHLGSQRLQRQWASVSVVHQPAQASPHGSVAVWLTSLLSDPLRPLIIQLQHSEHRHV